MKVISTDKIMYSFEGKHCHLVVELTPIDGNNRFSLSECLVTFEPEYSLGIVSRVETPLKSGSPEIKPSLIGVKEVIEEELKGTRRLQFHQDEINKEVFDIRFLMNDMEYEVSKSDLYTNLLIKYLNTNEIRGYSNFVKYGCLEINYNEL